MTWALIILCFVNSIAELSYAVYRKAEGIGALFALIGLITILAASGMAMKLLMG